MTLETVGGEALIQENLERFLLVLTVSLSVATLPQVFSWVRQIPYTLLLVIVGLGLAFVDVRLVNLSPELILSIFLPPLLFEAAWNLRWKNLKRDLVPVSFYAIVGVLISVVGIALALNQFAGISLTTALLLGASLSATDPVSVIALFRELGVDKRLSTLMEGESLCNDGVAVVAFSLLVGLALGTEQFEVRTSLAQFFAFVGIGVGVGSLIGFGISYLTQRFDLPLVEQSLTLVSAYGTYLITEELGGSGVIGVVTAGVILGNFGSRIGMNPRTRLIVTEFWEFLAFFVNSIVFLLIGDQIEFASLADNLGSIAITIVAVLGTRALSIYSLGAVSNLITKSDLSLREQTVLWWGGLRGSVSIALALSVPIVLEAREEIIATVFGVVLFTLLVQGLTTKPLLKRLNLLGEQTLRQQYVEAIARRTALERVLERLDAENLPPDIDPEFYRYQIALVKGQLEEVEKQLKQLRIEEPDLQDFAREQFKEELLAIEADTYAELVRAGRLTKELAPFLQEVLQEEG
ncbi:cation:proton antiporter [Phormidium sp. CCY1219]|uniref:cation:proton antiporter n=1 Tax=Phormidium sp. CCY1219 TaxID=2886104 RepID=UPI002D1F859A|nr:sodium:proton antiporter [Phormidium sp. CCY1219]MEB3829917.1 sodium:proton antiporter [Phormidium sp. CCY1219]